MPGEFLYFQNNNQNIQGKIFLEDIFSKLCYSIGIQIHNRKIVFQLFFFQYHELIHFIGNCIRSNMDSKFAKTLSSNILYVAIISSYLQYILKSGVKILLTLCFINKMFLLTCSRVLLIMRSLLIEFILSFLSNF